MTIKDGWPCKPKAANATHHLMEIIRAAIREHRADVALLAATCETHKQARTGSARNHGDTIARALAEARAAEKAKPAKKTKAWDKCATTLKH